MSLVNDVRAAVVGCCTTLQGLPSSLQGCLQPLQGNSSLAQGLADAADGCCCISWHQDQVCPCFKGQHGRFGGAGMAGDRLHHQGIGHHQPVEFQITAQQVGQHLSGEGGRPLWIQLWKQQMGGHHTVDPCFDQRFERWQLQLIQPRTVVGQHRQIEMGIAGGVAMAGEVLGAAQYSTAGETPLESTRQGRDGFRLFPPGAHIDHRIVRIVVDIADRSQNPIEPAALRLFARALAIALRKGQGALRIPGMQACKGQGRHQPAAPLEALADAFLHIGAEQQGLLTPAPKLTGALLQLHGASPEEDYASDAALQQVLQLRVVQFPLGIAPLAVVHASACPHHQQAGDLTL